MEEDLVSIVIPVYNSAKYIKEAVESIEKQTYKRYEAIFVDDGSTDESREILKEYRKKNEKIKLILLKKHRGVAIARNIGIYKAKGRYLTFLDSDDLLVENKLEVQKKFMEQNEYEFVYGSFRYLNDIGNKISSPVKVMPKVDYKQSLLNMRLLTITVMLDLKKIPKRYCYMPNVMNEDIATWWKILKKGYIAYGQKEVLAYYRKTKKSRSSRKSVTARARWELYRNLEKLGIGRAAYCFVNYVISAIKKRMVRWQKYYEYTEEDLEVLVSTRNLKEERDVDLLLENMKIQSKYLIVNQSKTTFIENDCVVTKNEMGLSKSRNCGIQTSNAEIILFADDDVKYLSNYASIISQYHNKYDETDIICFYVESRNKKRKTKKLLTGKVGFLKSMRIVSFEISAKRRALINNEMYFNENFGAGTKFNRGEEQIFLYEALRKGMKIRFVNQKIGEAQQAESTWFSDFDDTFFKIQGRVFKEMTPQYYKLLIWQYAIRKYFTYYKKTSFVSAIRCMMDG